MGDVITTRDMASMLFDALATDKQPSEMLSEFPMQWSESCEPVLEEARYVKISAKAWLGIVGMIASLEDALKEKNE